MRKLFPYPLLSASIVLMWLVLSGFTLGQFLIGALVAFVGGQIMTLLAPEKVVVKNWASIILLFLRILVDITTSNLAVAKIILFGRRGKGKPGFIIISLDLKNHTGLAVLACVLTATPGTAWVSYNSKNSELLLHVLDLEDEAYWQNLIKTRYEALLLEAFE